MKLPQNYTPSALMVAQALQLPSAKPATAPIPDNLELDFNLNKRPPSEVSNCVRLNEAVESGEYPSLPPHHWAMTD